MRYLPGGLLLLFSLLLWAFYAAPVFKVQDLLGTIEGNVYQIYGERMLSEFHGAILTLYVFTPLATVAGAVSLFLAYKGRRLLPSILTLVFYLHFFSLGIALAVIDGKYLSVGACPILIILFSCLFAAINIVAFVLEWKLQLPSAKEGEGIAIEYEQELPPVLPQPVKRPIKPTFSGRDCLNDDERTEFVKRVDRHVQNKRILACLLWLPLLIGGLCELIGGAMENWYIGYHTMYTMSIIEISCSGLVIVVAPIVCRCIHVKGWHPEKVYRRGGSIMTLVFAASMILESLISLATIFGEAGGSINFEFSLWTSVVFFLLILLLILFVVIFESITLHKGGKLSKMLCGAGRPIKNPDLYMQFNREWSAYAVQRAAYKKYRRDLTAYRYSTPKEERQKIPRQTPFAWMWIMTHKIAVSAMALVLVAVVVFASVFATKDWRFTLGTVSSVRLGYSGWNVQDVLGDPDNIVGNVWYYYDDRAGEMQRKMGELSAKMESVTSPSELNELMEEYNSLERQLEQMEFKAIVITFQQDEYDSTVSSVLFNTKMKAIPGKKEVVGVTIYPDYLWSGWNSDDLRKIRYEIEYADGSYQSAYLSPSVLSQAVESANGDYTISWSDQYGDYSATLRNYH